MNRTEKTQPGGVELVIEVGDPEHLPEASPARVAVELDREQADAIVELLAARARDGGGPRPGDEPTTAGHYRSRLEDMRSERDTDDEDSYGPDALSIETEVVHRIVLGTGGPHDEVAVRYRGRDVVGGHYFRVWGTESGTWELTADEAEEWADAYCLSDQG